MVCRFESFSDNYVYTSQLVGEMRKKLKFSLILLRKKTYIYLFTMQITYGLLEV